MEDEDQVCELPTTQPCFQEAKWRRRINTHSEAVIACLNPLELIPYLDSHQLLDDDDNDYLANVAVTRKEKVLRILKVLETSEERDAHSKFITCLTEELSRGEGVHIGHRYLHAVLKEEQYATDSECQASEACKRRIRKHCKDMHDIDLSSLVPVLYASHLITTNEEDMLYNTNRTRIERIEQLLQLLKTKGLLGHALFAQCLGKETTHPSHSELHKKITGAEEGVCLLSRKRKRAVRYREDSIPKRTPAIIRMEEPLCGELYFTFVADIRECYRTNSWAKLELTVQNFIEANDNPQLRAMATIEKAYSFSCKQGMRMEAIECLEAASRMVHQFEGNNYWFLMARCKHIRATMYRYSGEEDKSYQENEEAFDLLFNCERADDDHESCMVRPVLSWRSLE